jgi:hypothetical protein
MPESWTCPSGRTRAAVRSARIGRVGSRQSNVSGPKNYRTIEEFEREELRPQYKAGFSLDDLMQETMLHESDLLFDDQVDEYDLDDDDDT